MRIIAIIFFTLLNILFLGSVIKYFIRKQTTFAFIFLSITNIINWSLIFMYLNLLQDAKNGSDFQMNYLIISIFSYLQFPILTKYLILNKINVTRNGNKPTISEISKMNMKYYSRVIVLLSFVVTTVSLFYIL